MQHKQGNVEERPWRLLWQVRRQRVECGSLFLCSGLP